MQWCSREGLTFCSEIGENAKVAEYGLGWILRKTMAKLFGKKIGHRGAGGTAFLAIFEEEISTGNGKFASLESDLYFQSRQYDKIS